MSAARRTVDPFSAFLVVSCLVLAVLVVLLARENRSLKEQVALAAADSPGLREGDAVSPFTLAAPDGRTETLALDGRGPRTLLLVFTSTCPHCERTLPVWREVLAAPISGVRVVGLQLDAATAGGAGLLASALPFPVFAPGTPPPEFLSRVPGVPAAILLRPDGTVEKAWHGAPGPAERRSLERALRG